MKLWTPDLIANAKGEKQKLLTAALHLISQAAEDYERAEGEFELIEAKLRAKGT